MTEFENIIVWELGITCVLIVAEMFFFIWTVTRETASIKESSVNNNQEGK